MRTGFALAILMLSGLAATQVVAAPVAELAGVRAPCGRHARR